MGLRVSPAALATLAVCLALGATACGGTSASQSTPKFRGGTIVKPPQAPDFVLHDQSGRVVRLSAFHGPRIVTFLYTHCPDVCPIITENLNLALRELGPQRDKVRVLAVSVDPHGDTRKAVRHFARVHRLLPQFLYLTGSAPRLQRVWRDYGVTADPDRTDQAISHSSFEILVDQSGRERLLYDARVKAADVVHDVHTLLKTE
ncbi:MAG: hypothetical protein C5B48_10840 [Candidatus Rokuibacteriota bacterium]|nr:MAG: hypothetical protein C5B48_10840 [Candidatus Rokubacteria bacterium]